eukprot:15116787-Ditylum_brightwellii.AAC.2
MARAKPKTEGKVNKVVSFYSFYKQRLFNNSKKEFHAEQGHCDCICTANCTDADKAECDQANDDSRCKSDWYICTCIHPCKYRACKAAETELKAQYSNNKCEVLSLRHHVGRT